MVAVARFELGLSVMSAMSYHCSTTAIYMSLLKSCSGLLIACWTILVLEFCMIIFFHTLLSPLRIIFRFSFTTALYRPVLFLQLGRSANSRLIIQVANPDFKFTYFACILL